MRYPGAFTFINRDSATLPNVKDHKDDTAISTHISRTRRKWTEEKRKVRLELLGRPDRKAQVVDVKAIPRRSSTPFPSRQLFENRSSLSDTSTPDHQCDRPWSCPQCYEAWVLALHSGRTQRTTSPIHLLKGNSDPFSASSVPITPEINELLELSSRFYVFWAWSVSASTLFRAKAHDAWLKSVRAAPSVQGAAELRVMLASGASTKARLLKQAYNVEAQYRQEAQALMHKTRALTQLRNELCVEAPSSFPTIFRLVSPEFREGNFQAALWHHKAVGELTSRIKGFDVRQSGAGQGSTLYAVGEVWAAAAALQKPAPCGMVDWSGERRASEATGGAPQPPGSSNLFLYDLEWPELHPSVTPAAPRKIFKEIQKLTMFMERFSTLGKDGIDIYEAVSYLGARSSAIRAEILNMWLDFEDPHHPKGPGQHEEKLDDLIFSALCMAALLFINIIFMYRPNNSVASAITDKSHTPAVSLMSCSVNNKPLHRLQNLLHQIHWLQLQPDHGPTPAQGCIVDLHLMTWLCFIAALAETLEAESQALLPETSLSIDGGAGSGPVCFTNSLAMLGFRHWRNVKEALSRFLYYEDLMDGYLEKMSEILVR